MKLLIEVEYHIDGALSQRRAESIIMNHLYNGNIILSENVDGTSDWAIEIDSVSQKKSKNPGV